MLKPDTHRRILNYLNDVIAPEDLMFQKQFISHDAHVDGCMIDDPDMIKRKQMKIMDAQTAKEIIAYRDREFPLDFDTSKSLKKLKLISDRFEAYGISLVKPGINYMRTRRKCYGNMMNQRMVFPKLHQETPKTFSSLYPGLHLLPNHTVFYTRTRRGSAGAGGGNWWKKTELTRKVSQLTFEIFE